MDVIIKRDWEAEEPGGKDRGDRVESGATGGERKIEERRENGHIVARDGREERRE